MTKRIDGKLFAEKLREKVRTDVALMKQNHGVTVGLAVILVGDNPASAVYVRNKKAQTIEAGIRSFDIHLPASVSQSALLAEIQALNQNPDVHGILVQLPLPKQIDERAIINAIDPAKDVDGFHVVNIGKLFTSQPDALIPCTPQGCMLLIHDELGEDLSGKHAVVIGRSNIVGKPMAQLLLNAHCTVTICHSRTEEIERIVKQGDIVVAAVGIPEIVTGDWIKAGAVVIDVGINRVEGEEGKTRLVGDVAYEEVAEIAHAITPVPGGVGPMTIACLLRNTLQAAAQIHGLLRLSA